MDPKSYRTYSNFLKSLSFKLTRFYFKKLDKSFVVYNKLKGKGYDPVTTSDKAFEKFIRKEIKMGCQKFLLDLKQLVNLFPLQV